MLTIDRHIFYISLSLGLFFALGRSTVVAQEYNDQYIDMLTHILQVEREIGGYIDRVNEIYDSIDKATVDNIEDIERTVDKLSIRWSVYYPKIEADVADDDSLLTLVTTYNALSKGLPDSIALKKHYFESEVIFADAQKLIEASIEPYKEFAESATKYSLVKQTAELLAKLQADEQIEFAKVDGAFSAAQAVNSEFPQFQPRMDSLSLIYSQITTASQSVQDAKFVPLFQRIKDYLMGLAAVAMLLMFINMVQTKVSMAIKMRKNAKKMMDQIRKSQEGDYPTI